MLNIWYKNDDSLCNLCKKDEDTIEHYFFRCENINCFWISFMNWFKPIYNVSFILGCVDVIFGIVNNNNDSVLNVLNFCILHGKWYIRKKKSKEEEITLKGFLHYISKRLEVEKYSLTGKGKSNYFMSKWGPLVDRLHKD